MSRAVKAGELFSTFIFDGKDCADMGVYNVTSGSVYTMNIEPTYSDNKIEVPSYDGKYYYGTQITGQQFQFTCFCHDLLATEYNRLRAWLSPRVIGRLILSDQPYKYYIVKVSSISNLNAYPLTTVQTPDNSLWGDCAEDDPVYTGNFTVTFETVGSAYGYGLSYYRDDLIYDAKDYYTVGVYPDNYYYDSGLLYKDMSPRLTWNIACDVKNYPISMYNPGSASAYPILEITLPSTMSDNTYIALTNNTTDEAVQIDISGLSGTITIDTAAQIITDENNKAYYGRFDGTAFSISPTTGVTTLLESFIQIIEYKKVVYDTFYIEDNLVSINPLAFTVSNDLLGRYFCCNNNGGSPIVSVDVDNNTLTLDDSVVTYDLPPATSTRPAGFAYNYIEIYNDESKIPSSPSLGDVYVLNDVWYVYMYDKWCQTSLFSSKDEFKDIYGNYQTIYRMCGANIVNMDDISITTGANLSYKINGEIKKGAAISGDITISAMMQPRYL